MITIAEIAKLVGGRIDGNPDLMITGAAPIRDAKPGDITLADDPKFASKLRQSQVAAVIVPADFPLPSFLTPSDVAGVAKTESSVGNDPPVANQMADPPAACRLTCVIVDDVHKSFAKIVRYLAPPALDSFAGISGQAFVAATAQIGADCTIEPFAVIGEHVVLGDRVHVGSGTVLETACHIGNDTRLYARNTLYAKTIVGQRCLIHAGCVIGANGFGYITKDKRHHLSAQLGHVEIGDDVEIGANTTIDRGTYNATVVGDGTKIDNQVMIAHNCRIGKHNLICSQVGIAGSCRTGDHVTLAGQVGIGDHIDIGTGATLAAKSGVMNHIPAKSMYMGIPAAPIREQMKTFAVVNKLSQWYTKWKDMLLRIERIEQLLHSVDPPATAPGSVAPEASSWSLDSTDQNRRAA